jgi:hypothetical protein
VACPGQEVRRAQDRDKQVAVCSYLAFGRDGLDNQACCSVSIDVDLEGGPIPAGYGHLPAVSEAIEQLDGMGEVSVSGFEVARFADRLSELLSRTGHDVGDVLEAVDHFPKDGRRRCPVTPQASQDPLPQARPPQPKSVTEALLERHQVREDPLGELHVRRLASRSTSGSAAQPEQDRRQGSIVVELAEDLLGIDEPGDGSVVAQGVAVGHTGGQERQATMVIVELV